MTPSEENYLKVVYHLSQHAAKGVNTNAIAAMMDTRPSSVTDMLQKLADKGMVLYEKYKGVSLTEEGKLTAKMIVRKHRLWEVFLVDKLHFSWDEVHEVAEQLEHIASEQLIEKLDAFLGYPTEDPHGDPIPDKKGRIKKIEKQLLSAISPGQKVVCTGVKDSSAGFLNYLDRHKIALGSELEIIARENFDDSLSLLVDNREVNISDKIASNLYVKIA